MNKQVKPVVIGTIHGNGYEKVSGVPIRLKTVCDLNLDLANQVKERYGYEQAITNFDDMLADPEIDVIDIVTPPFLHCSMAIKALKAGKHVVTSVRSLSPAISASPARRMWAGPRRPRCIERSWPSWMS